MKRVPWCDRAGAALASTLDDCPPATLEEDVRRGRLELWELSWDSWADSYAVLQEQGNELYVWAYAGSHLRAATAAIADLARSRGLTSLGFRTQHRGLPRLIGAFHPKWMRRLGDYHSEYRIEVRA